MEDTGAEENNVYNEQWSTVVANTERKDRSAIRRSADPMVHPELGINGCRTLYESFRRGQALNPLGPCMGFRAVSTNGFATPYIYSSYTECIARVNAFAAGLDHLKLLQPNEEGISVLAIYMRNCMEWIIAEQGAFCLGGATVALYDTLGPDTAQFILNETEVSAVVSTRQQLPKLCEVKKSGNCPKFIYAICIDGVTPEAAKIANDANLEVISFAKIEAIGAQKLAESTNNLSLEHHHNPPSGKDIATFCYTSGTTGNPKGAMLTHENIISSMAGVPESVRARTTDRHLSYLPLAHIFERIVINQMFAMGASVAFFRGDPQLLIEDIQACRPTMFPAAPRVLNKIYDKIQAGISSAGGMKKKIFDMGIAAKSAGLKQGKLRHKLYDGLIFNKIKKALGLDSVRLMVSGSAPLSANVMVFFRCLLGIPVVEGYGQTEGSGVASCGEDTDLTTVGHVGGPFPCCEIMLQDVPEMGYLHTDTFHRDNLACRGRGEICVRGPNVFKGYYKNEEKTKEMIDDEGWLHSGDIGLWTTNGQLQIIDRKKNLFKLSQGEYVAPEKIENILIRSPFISQCFVHGDSFQNSLVAVVVLDEEPVRNWLSSSSTTPAPSSSSSFEEICKANNAELKKVVAGEIQALSKETGLHGFETVRAIHLETTQFDAETNGLATPTFKLKRQQLRDYYKNEIEHMYANEVAPPPSRL